MSKRRGNLTLDNATHRQRERKPAWLPAARITLAGPNTNLSIFLAGTSTLTVFGQAGAVDEHINLLTVQLGTTFDLGAGSNDSLALFGQSGFLNTVTVKNVETVTGTNFGDTIVIGNASGDTTVAGFDGDNMTASAGADHFRYTSIADSPQVGNHDIITNFDAGTDTFVFSNMSGLTGFQNAIELMGTDAFTARQAKRSPLGGASEWNPAANRCRR